MGKWASDTGLVNRMAPGQPSVPENRKPSTLFRIPGGPNTSSQFRWRRDGDGAPFEIGDEALRGGLVHRGVFEIPIESAYGLDIRLPYAEEAFGIGGIAHGDLTQT